MNPNLRGVPFGRRSPPKRGPFFHAESHRNAPLRRTPRRHTFAVPPSVDLLWIHLPTPGHIRNTRARHQRFPDDRPLVLRRPAAATDKPGCSRNAPITPCIIIAVKHDDRPKPPSASGKTSTSAVAATPGRQSTAYERPISAMLYWASLCGPLRRSGRPTQTARNAAIRESRAFTEQANRGSRGVARGRCRGGRVACQSSAWCCGLDSLRGVRAQALGVPCRRGHYGRTGEWAAFGIAALAANRLTLAEGARTSREQTPCPGVTLGMPFRAEGWPSG